MVQYATPNGCMTGTVSTGLLGDHLMIFCHEGWTDEEFNTVLEHHGLMDKYISEWDYGILPIPGGTIEVWVIHVDS